MCGGPHYINCEHIPFHTPYHKHPEYKVHCISTGTIFHEEESGYKNDYDKGLIYEILEKGFFSKGALLIRLCGKCEKSYMKTFQNEPDNEVKLWSNYDYTRRLLKNPITFEEWNKNHKEKLNVWKEVKA